MIKRGDVACTLSPTFFGRAIKAVTGWLSRDGKAEFGHSLIITSDAGDTLEALWTIRAGNLSHYRGKNIIIARPIATVDYKEIRYEMIDKAICEIERDYLGHGYPWWRLLLYPVQPLARIFGKGMHLVCSELVAKYLSLIRARHSVYLGTTPDNLADEWTYWRNFEIIYKGTWK